MAKINPMKWGLSPALLSLFLAIAINAAAKEQSTQIARVMDHANLLKSTDFMALDQKLEALEKDVGAQIAILIVQSTQPQSIEQYAFNQASQLQLGRKDVDDGVLIVVALDDRAVRIEVGYGLEGAIPDAIAKRIIDEKMLPAFKEGAFFKGLNDGLDWVILRIKGEKLPTVQEKTKAPLYRLVKYTALFFLLLQLILILAIPEKAVGASLGAVPFSVPVFFSSGYFWLASLVFSLLSIVFLFDRTAIQFNSPRNGTRLPSRKFDSWTGGGGGFRGGGGSFGGGGASGRW